MPGRTTEMDVTWSYYSWQEPIGICVLEKIWHESMRESILAYIMKETGGKRFAVKKIGVVVRDFHMAKAFGVL